MEARTRQQFVQAWQNQFKEFACLTLQAATPATLSLEVTRYNSLREVVHAMIERAADHAFPGYGALPGTGRSGVDDQTLGAYLWPEERERTRSEDPHASIDFG